MSLDPKQFFRATNPSKTLNINKPEDAQYYIDFSEVRGGQVIDELCNKISWSDQFTCSLFTGHIGCGKSTELFRLQDKLEREENFIVLYFEADDDLNMGDIEISDILLAIARRVSKILEGFNQENKENQLKGVLQKAKELLLTKFEVDVNGQIPGVGDFGIKFDEQKNVNFTLSTMLGKITAKTKGDSNLSNRLRGYLEPRTEGILEVLNEGLFIPVDKELKRQNKGGLVVIIDNLDRVINIKKDSGTLQSNYIFAQRGSSLSRLSCHLVYTMPLDLRYSDDYPIVVQKFKSNPIVLPMVPPKVRDGKDNDLGMKLLKKMVLVRAFPNLSNQYDYLSEEEILNKITEVFDDVETLNTLCLASGGHVRNLLIILNDWIKKDKQLPLSLAGLNKVLTNELSEKVQGITSDEWELLRKVKEEKTVSGDYQYEKLIRNLLVYEYRDDQGSWYDVNPILLMSDKLS
ncbi:MAG: ATP-binding protein [Crocosphaera sp.]